MRLLCVAEPRLFLKHTLWDGEKGHFISPEGCNEIEMPLSKLFFRPLVARRRPGDSLPPLYLIGHL